MGEILQDSEEYILQWYDVEYDKWGESREVTYEVAVSKMEQYKKNDKTWGDNYKYRIVKQTTKQEVVYDEFENQG
jgi:hypothetical protein